MKALVLEEYNKLVYRDWPDPEVSDDEVLVEVKAVGICGSDVHGMDGSSGRRIPPIVMGHEASGVIVSTGKNVNGWKTGNRVTFDSTIYPLDDWYTQKGLYNLSDNRMVLGVSPGDYRRHGAFAEYVNIPMHILYRIPNDVSFTQAAMVEPIGVAAHGIELTPLSWNDTALVVGAGMIGLEKLGASHTLNPARDNILDEVLARSEGRGADVAFEAVGISDTVNTAIECARKGATVTLVGNLSPTVEIPLQSVVTREIRLQGSCGIAGEFPAVLDMIARKEINTSAFLSAEAPLSEGADWFKRLYKKEPELIKVVLIPGE